MSEYIEKTMANEEVSEKIKTINPQIIVGGTIDKPCYSISYYDVKRKEWVIGFSSFNREYVQGWLAECFEEVEAELAEVVRCKNCKFLNKQQMLCLHDANKVFGTGKPTYSECFCNYGKRKE